MNTLPVVMFKCPECGAEWQHYAGERHPESDECSGVRIPQAYYADPKEPEENDPETTTGGWVDA